jgi:hypothetical protein
MLDADVATSTWTMTWCYQVGPRGVIFLVHVVLSGWSTWCDMVGPCGFILLVHVALSGWSTWCDLIGPRVINWLVHVSCSGWSMCRYLVGPHVVIWLAHVSPYYWSTCRLLIGPCGFLGIRHVTVCGDYTWVLLVVPHVHFFIGTRFHLWVHHVATSGCTTLNHRYIPTILDAFRHKYIPTSGCTTHVQINTTIFWTHNLDTISYITSS